MSAPMTPERLAEIRAWLAWEYRASLGERGEQIAAELLAEVDRLRRLLGSHADADYWRWQGHAESRRHLTERLAALTSSDEVQP